MNFLETATGVSFSIFSKKSYSTEMQAIKAELIALQIYCLIFESEHFTIKFINFSVSLLKLDISFWLLSGSPE